MVTPTEIESTAVHEAGHAVLHIALGLGLKHVTIVPNYEEETAGASTHGGEFGGEEDEDTLRLFAEDAFWLRHAMACYAGAEAVRQLRPNHPEPEAGAADDFHNAAIAINKITMDEASIDLYFKLAERRCTVLVEHYAPEIEALAAELVVRETLTGEEAREVFRKSLSARRAGLMNW